MIRQTLPHSEHGESDLDSQLQSVGTRLNAAISGLIEAVPGGPHRPRQLAEALHLKKDISHRVVRATQQQDPVASMHLMPGPEALRRLLQASEISGVAPSILSEASDAINEFDQLIRVVAGTRGRFDNILSGWLPEARERVDLLSRQSIQRGMVGIKGVSAKLKFSIALLVPSQDPRFVDLLFIIGAVRLSRFRPGVHVRFATRHLDAPTQLNPIMLGKTGAQPEEPSLDLSGFLDPPIGRLVSETQGTAVHFILESASIGNVDASNVVMAELGRAAMHRYEVSPEAPRRRGPFAEVDIPAEALNLDVIVHKDVYPDAEPDLTIFDTACRGPASVNDPTRQIDRLDHAARIDALDLNPSLIRLKEVPSYSRIVSAGIGFLGRDPAEFRGYRCRIEYPVYGSSVHATFAAPPPPDEFAGEQV